MADIVVITMPAACRTFLSLYGSPALVPVLVVSQQPTIYRLFYICRMFRETADNRQQAFLSFGRIYMPDQLTPRPTRAVLPNGCYPAAPVCQAGT